MTPQWLWQDLTRSEDWLTLTPAATVQISFSSENFILSCYKSGPRGGGGCPEGVGLPPPLWLSAGLIHAWCTLGSFQRVKGQRWFRQEARRVIGSAVVVCCCNSTSKNTSEATWSWTGKGGWGPDTCSGGAAASQKGRNGPQPPSQPTETAPAVIRTQARTRVRGRLWVSAANACETGWPRVRKRLGSGGYKTVAAAVGGIRHSEDGVWAVGNQRGETARNRKNCFGIGCCIPAPYEVRVNTHAAHAASEVQSKVIAVESNKTGCISQWRSLMMTSVEPLWRAAVVPERFQCSPGQACKLDTPAPE